MTALYSYCSDEVSFIGADNIEFVRQKRVDKVALLSNRYACAVAGQDVVFHALNYADYFDGKTPNRAFRTVADLCEGVARATEALAQQLYPEYLKAVQARKISVDEWQIITSQGSTLVVLDLHENALWEATIAPVFPPGAANPTKTTTARRSSNILHLDALARRAHGSSTENVTREELLDIDGLLTARLDRDRAQISAIGQLGARIVWRQTSNVEFRSTFSDVADFIAESHKGGLLGFSIAITPIE